MSPRAARAESVPAETSARKRLGQITAPALIVHSREDDQANLSNALEAVRGIPSKTELVVLDDSYHLVTLDRQRMVVMDKTIAFSQQRIAEIEKQRDRVAAKRATPALREVGGVKA